MLSVRFRYVGSEEWDSQTACEGECLESLLDDLLDGYEVHVEPTDATGCEVCTYGDGRPRPIPTPSRPVPTPRGPVARR